ncbi:MAG: PadR family transcriptional regulator [Frankiaceae bacterium]
MNPIRERAGRPAGRRRHHHHDHADQHDPAHHHDRAHHAHHVHDALAAHHAHDPHGAHDLHGGRRRGGRGRASRGDVRAAILLLLAEEPMHGYQLMQAISDRTGGRWTPSPGAVYPAISQLEDEGLVTVTADAGRKLVALTDAGREHLAAHREAWGDPYAGYGAAGPGGDLRGLLAQLHEAARVVARTGTDAQRSAAAAILAEARRSLYLLLADGGQEEPDA